MKRTVILLLALLILLLSSVCFLTGCGLPSLESIIAMGSDAQAAAIITASNLVMSDETLSYRADTKTHATLIMSNIFTEFDMETYEVSVAPNAETGEGFCGYVRSKTVATFPYSAASKTESTSTVGYCDGKMYVSVRPTGTGQAKTFWSYATRKEYEEFLLAGTSGNSNAFNMLGYETRACQYSEETKCFTLTLSNPNKETRDAWEQNFGGANLNIENVTLTYTVGENFLPLETKTEITRLSGWETITSQTVYTYENVTYDDKTTLYDYNESPSLLLIKTFQKEVAKSANRQEGAYTYAVSATANGDKNNAVTETDRVQFGKDENGNFTFTIRVDEQYTVAYENGKMTSNAPGGVTKYIDDDEARAIIDAQLSIGGFANASFSSFKALDEEEGRYVLTAVSSDTSAFSEIIAQVGSNIRYVGSTFYITYRDGVLYSCQCVTVISFQNSGSLEISATLTLKEE